jgi:osmoprotectant transport system ATP-binding protein
MFREPGNGFWAVANKPDTPHRAAMEPAISLIGASKRYGDGPPALARVTVSVGAREFLAVVGGSGSGKTTLLRLINRLSQPSEGAVVVRGTNVQDLDAIGLRRSIGYVFQGIGLFPHLTVAENITITPKLLGWSASQQDARAAELLNLVRLDASYAKRFPHELSGGERQRVGVARALAAKPDIVLMDEPFGALDPLTRDALGGDYRRMHESLGLTSVMITHDMLEALLLADRIIVLQRGQLIAEGPPATLMHHEHPYVRELMATPRRQAERLAAFLGGQAH